MRYRLQRKEPYTMPNILGNHSMPVHTYRWKDIAISDDLEALKKAMPMKAQKVGKMKKPVRLLATLNKSPLNYQILGGWALLLSGQ